MPVYRKRRTRAEELLRLGLSTVGVVLLVFLAVVALRGTWNMYVRMASASDAKQASQQRLLELEAQKEKMQRDVAGLSTPRGEEAALRERYGVAKPGEGIIQIVEADSATTTPTEGGVVGFIKRLFQALFVW